ncbi:MAG: DUF3794 domain-containing protein, partial [Eubacteriales bacterium]|nr:DUF3794 domain-containing protein [Eubacteriales bacterium]
IEGIDKSMTVFTTCNITNLDYKLINDRKVSFRAVLDVNSEVLSKENFETIAEIEGLDEKQIKKTTVNINKIACAKFDRFNIKAEIELSSGRPNVKEILECNLNISNKEIKVSENKLNVSGNIKACILYKGDEEGSMPVYFEQEIPFNGALEADAVNENMFADVYLDIQDRNINIYEDADREDRIIGIDAYIGCNIKVSYEDQVDVLEDAYILNKSVQMDTNIQKYPILICKNKNQAPIKEIIKLEEGCPPILQVVKVCGKPILDNVQILEDKVLAEGIIECNILYITNNDEYPMHCYKAIVPYSQTIEAKGALPENTDVDINIDLEHIGVNMVSDKDLELRCVLNLDVCVLMEKSLSFIIGILLEDIDEEILNNIGSMNIYIVQPGDTLWCLAKKFNTTVDDIVELNDIENPDLIYPGQKLLILKKVC